MPSSYVNFSTPGRRSQLALREARPSMDGLPEHEAVGIFEVRPKAKCNVQLHVTSDEISSLRPSSEFDFNARDYATSSSSHRPTPSSSTLSSSRPSIPQRTSSLSSTNWRTNLDRKLYSSSSHSSRTAGSHQFESTPTLVRTPWEWDRDQPKSKWSRAPSDRGRSSTGGSLFRHRLFAELPKEIYQRIVDHLEDVHTASERSVDVVALRRDLRSLCLVNRQFHRIARAQLYRELYLPSNDIPPKKRWSSKVPRSNLRMLLETIASISGLGYLIQTIHIPPALISELDQQAYAPIHPLSTLSLLEHLVRSAYSLLHLTPWIPPTTPSTRPLFEALSSRTRLKFHAWNLDSARATLPNLSDFLHTHDQWLHLSTLSLVADMGVDLGFSTLPEVFARLPLLRHLALQGLHPSDFNSASIASLPSLTSLRLDSLPAISDDALRFLPRSITNLQLLNLNITSLRSIQLTLLILSRLTHLTLIQPTAPEPQISSPLPDPFSTNHWEHSTLNPFQLVSHSLTHLHWHCPKPGNALSCIAASIIAPAADMNSTPPSLPALREVVVPADTDGRVQAVCRSVPRMRVTRDDVLFLQSWEVKLEHEAKSPPSEDALRKGRDGVNRTSAAALRAAGLYAQIRIREAVRKSDEEGDSRNGKNGVEDTVDASTGVKRLDTNETNAGMNVAVSDGGRKVTNNKAEGRSVGVVEGRVAYVLGKKGVVGEVEGGRGWW